MDELPRKILTFRSGEESYPAILNEEELNLSPFSFPVNSALSALEDLYNYNKSLNQRAFSEFRYKIQNNIIAFLGNRGSGKTSCMRTTIQLCKSQHQEWLILDEIDPSFFDEKHNILDIFIGTLYGVFKKEMEKWETLSRSQQEELRITNDKFRHVKSALRYVKGDVKFDDEYETDELRHLNEGVKLSQLLHELVACLLKYKGRDFLLVSIDDLDLNVSSSYEMLEQLRKYLIIPNVTIIIAARFDQLFDNICLALTKHYKEIPNRVSQKDIAEMAERYLNKVLALNHRFEMPTVESYMDATLLIDEDINKHQKQNDLPVSVRIPDLIFKKTRYLFYNTTGIPSLVIPRNLRDLRMLVSLLSKMEDFDDGNKNNQETFKHYFFNEWMGIIEPEYRPFIKRLLEEEDFAKLNRFVVNNLYELFLKDIEPRDRLEQEVKDSSKQNINTSYTRRQTLKNNILNPRNSYWNVSIGDVIVIMNEVKKSHDSAKTLSLLFVITTFYSIKLYETYNQLTDKTDKYGVKVSEELPTTNPELKTSIRADIPSYFRLVGGAFFAESGDSFIPPEQGDKESRALRIINAGFLLPEIRSVVNEYKKLEKQKNGCASPQLKARLRLCEFFMLTVTERVETKRNINRRLISEPLYLAPFGANAKNLAFDITRPFFSSVYPKLSYDRFHSEIYNIAYKEEDSILNRMRNHAETRHKPNDTWELMSKTAIRNMEILEDLTHWMFRKREDIRPGANGLLGALKDYYNEFEIVETQKDKMPSKGYCVKTYYKGTRKTESTEEENNELPYYRIDYSIFSELGRFLNEIDESNQFEDVEDERTNLRNLFDAIMSEKNILILKDNYDKVEVRDALYPLCGHSVVDLAIGKDNEKISLQNLSMALAEITIENRFDFMGHLPDELEFYYKNEVITLYSSKIEHLRQQRAQLENEVSDAKESSRTRTENLKILKQERVQYRKLLVNTEVTYNEISAELTTMENVIAAENLSNTENLTKTQIASQEKKKNSILSLMSKQAAAKANISTYREHLDSITAQIEDLEKAINFFNQSQRKHEREIKKVDNDLERLTDNFNNRIPI